MPNSTEFDKLFASLEENFGNKSSKEIDISSDRETIKKAHLYESYLGKKQDRTLRKELGDKIYNFVSFYMFCVFFILVLSGIRCNSFTLSDTVLITILGTTTANVIGVLVIVATYYFNKNRK